LRREQLAYAIKKSKPDTPVYNLVREGIKALIMESRSINGEFINYLSDNQDLTSRYWQEFQTELRNYPEIIRHINLAKNMNNSNASLTNVAESEAYLPPTFNPS